MPFTFMKEKFMDYIKIGKILKPQGIKGELKVLPLTDDPARYHDLQSVYMQQDGGYISQQLKGVRVGHDAVYIFLERIYDRNAAETLRGRYLYIPREEAAPLPEGRFYIFDIVGCEVWNEQGKKLGTVAEVLQPGANDVYVVKGEKELLVPAVKAFISEMDVPHKRIVVKSEMLEEVSDNED